MRRFRPPIKDVFDVPHHYCVDCGVQAGAASTTGCGRMYPETMMVNDDGKWRCREHYAWQMKKKIDDVRLDVQEQNDNT